MDELRAMGMHHCWQKVAAEIGMDAFLAMWRILDTEKQWQHPKGGLELNLRRYKSYLMFQRNKYIIELNRIGMSSSEIRDKLELSFGEKLEAGRISGIVKGR